MKKIFNYILLLIFLQGCAIPQFSFKSGGANTKEIPANSVQVDYFENNSTIGGGFLGASFTESLRDLMQSQTKLDLVANNGDVQISGVIKDYYVSPINIQAGSESAAQNRLKMTVSVSTYFKNLELRCAQYRIKYIPAVIERGFSPILTSFLVERQKFV